MGAMFGKLYIEKNSKRVLKMNIQITKINTYVKWETIKNYADNLFIVF